MLVFNETHRLFGGGSTCVLPGGQVTPGYDLTFNATGIWNPTSLVLGFPLVCDMIF